MRRCTPAAAVLLLLAVVAAIYGGVTRNGFVQLDDPAYILENGRVRAGLAPPSLAWAFTSFATGNWHPVTWLSHMLDVQLFGVSAPAHHAVSALLHAATACVLLLVLRAATGALLPSLAAALLFAVHPLRVESVAWASERKDVLSGLFWMLALAAYLGYARRPGVRRLAPLLVLFALGLMSKPTLVVLPLVLLVLDFWPLGRFRTSPRTSLLREKAPLLALSAASAAVTLKAQSGSLAATVDLPLAERSANAVVSVAAYLGKTLWPASLAVFYPIVPGGPGTAKAIAALAALVAIGAAVALLRRRAPYLLAGCGWYLMALLPVLGLVQVGGQAMADRYTYLPSVGLCIAAAWTLAGLARGRAALAAAVVLSSAAVALAWGAMTVRTVALWRDGVTLFRHSLTATPPSATVHLALGLELARGGRIDESIAEFRAAADLRPDFADTWFNLGVSLLEKGDTTGAADAFRTALARQPRHAGAHNGLGIALAREGRLAQAAAEFREAVRAQPDFAPARENLLRAEELLR